MNKFLCIGLDISWTATGLCRKNNDKTELKTIKTKPKDFDNNLLRQKYIIDKIMDEVPDDTSLVCIEDYFTPRMPAQMGAAVMLIELGNSIRMALNERKIPFVIVAPTQIKKFASGKGKGPKGIVIREVYKRWNVDAKDDNQADAAGLAYMAYEIVKVANGSNINELPKYQMEVVKKVMKDRPGYNVSWR